MTYGASNYWVDIVFDTDNHVAPDGRVGVTRTQRRCGRSVVERGDHLQRGDDGHGLAVSRPSDDASAELCSRDQSQNGYSVIVRVNDRGPYHAGRVMDVSSRVADVLDMKAMGTAKVKVDYVGAAPMEGSDDSQLLASLRTDGSPANMIGYSAPVMMANAAAEQTDTIWSFFSGGGRGGQQAQPQPQPEAQPAPRLRPRRNPPPVQVASAPEPAPAPPEPVRVAAAPVDSGAPADSGDTDPTPPEPIRSAHLTKGAVPLPPPRPFDLSLSRQLRRRGDRRLALVRFAGAGLVRACVVPPRRPELHASAERALYLFRDRSPAAQEAGDWRL